MQAASSNIASPASLLLFDISDHLERLLYHAHTTFLFAQTDMVTTILPITSFALACAPLDMSSFASASCRVFHTVFWIYLHLLHFNVANQTYDPKEDELNKSWRPIPSGRITLESAKTLKWVTLLFCWAYSYVFGLEVLKASLTYTGLVFTYHYERVDRRDQGDFASSGCHGHWAMKSILVASGYTSMSWGSVLIAGCNRNLLDPISRTALSAIFLVFVTTTHTQDFRDVEGDRVIGRKTIPILLPTLARYTPLVFLLLWSVSLTSIWKLNLATSVVLNGLAALAGVRYILFKHPKSDRTSYTIYNVWLTLVLVLPGIHRYSNPLIYAIA